MMSKIPIHGNTTTPGEASEEGGIRSHAQHRDNGDVGGSSDAGITSLGGESGRMKAMNDPHSGPETPDFTPSMASWMT